MAENKWPELTVEAVNRAIAHAREVEAVPPGAGRITEAWCYSLVALASELAAVKAKLATETDRADKNWVMRAALEARLLEVTSTIEAIPFDERKFPTRQDMRVEIARLGAERDRMREFGNDLCADLCEPDGSPDEKWGHHKLCKKFGAALTPPKPSENARPCPECHYAPCACGGPKLMTPEAGT